MEFNKEITEYLTGEKFSSSKKIYFSPEKFDGLSRNQKLAEIIRGKRVIHFGCADHLPLIEEKIRKGKWLHKTLTDNASKCIGFDINKEAIDFIKNKLGYDNVHYLNILTDDYDFGNEKWDFIILGEIIEHTDNPVNFLQTILEKLSGKVNKIIITAPNVLNLFNIRYIRRNIEFINTDHRFWFTPFTLTKITMQAGFKNCQVTYAEVITFGFGGEVIKFLKNKLKIKQRYRANCFFSVFVIADF